MFRYLSIFVSLLLLSSCGKQELKEPQEYTGPQREVEDIEMFYLVDEHIKVKMFADIVYEFANGDRDLVSQ